MPDTGYVNYFAILGLAETAKAGEVRKNYKNKMKRLVIEIGSVEITEERRAYYLREMAKLNAAFYILRDSGRREAYWRQRAELIALEEQWRQAAESHQDEADTLRRSFDGRLKDFLARFIEEAMLEAGRDKECVEASHWDAAHERHAFRILRNYRQGLYRQILERLPYHEVTPPDIDWEKRARTVAALLAEKDSA